MQRQKKQLTTIQTAIFIMSIVLGTGIATLPRTITEKTQTPDGWISILLAGIIFLIPGRWIILLNRYYPKLTFFEYAPIILGKWPGNLANFIIILYMILTASYQLRGMYEMSHLYLLPSTPLNVQILVMIFLAIYLMNGGLVSMARLFGILLLISALVILAFELLSSQVFELQNVRPVMGLGIEPVLKGLSGTVSAFAGFEMMLLLNAHMSQKKQAWKTLAASISIPAFIYTVYFIVVAGGLGTDQVQTLIFPPLDLLRSFELTGILFERYESFLLGIWITQIFTTYSGLHYLASLGLARMTGKNVRNFTCGLAPVTFLIAVTPVDTNEFFTLGDICSYIQLFIVIIIVPLALGVAWLRNRLFPSYKK